MFGLCSQFVYNGNRKYVNAGFNGFFYTELNVLYFLTTDASGVGGRGQLHLLTS